MPPKTGQQRLSIERLQQWERLGRGVMFHFGMSTFDGNELSRGDWPATEYKPDQLDIAQWVSLTRDAGMRYALLCAKHVSGFCLWPSQHTDYHVGNSGNTTDVVGVFVEECRKKGVIPGFYYCSWDNHHLFGSKTPGMVDPNDSYTTAAYREFQTRQLDELLTQYGDIGEVWIDIPGLFKRDARLELYHHLADLSPDTIIVMNHGLNNGMQFRIDYAWPCDVMTLERVLPDSVHGHRRWRHIEGADYYLPGEFVDTLGYYWFYDQRDRPRPDADLLGMYLAARARQTVFNLSLGPDPHGRIPQAFADSLLRLGQNIARYDYIDFFLPDDLDVIPLPEPNAGKGIPLV